MEKVIGNYVEIILKEGVSKKIGGLLVSYDDNFVYVQSEARPNMTYIVPLNNISYYLANITQTPSILDKDSESAELQQSNTLKVFVDNSLVATIIIPDNVNLLQCNNDLLSLAYGNQNVKNALHGKTQRQIRYDIGEMYIETIQESVYMSNDSSIPSVDEFSMSPNLHRGYENPKDFLLRQSTKVK